MNNSQIFRGCLLYISGYFSQASIPDDVHNQNNQFLCQSFSYCLLCFCYVALRVPPYFLLIPLCAFELTALDSELCLWSLCCLHSDSTCQILFDQSPIWMQRFQWHLSNSCASLLPISKLLYKTLYYSNLCIYFIILNLPRFRV